MLVFFNDNYSFKLQLSLQPNFVPYIMHVYLNCNEPKVQDGLLQRDKHETFFFNHTKNNQKGFGFDLRWGIKRFG